MSDLFTSDFFVANRRRLRELFTGTAPIVITANGLLQRGGDSTYPFHQDPNFWYLTGIDEPDIVLVMDKDKEYLLVPGRDQSREALAGQIDDRALTRRSGVAEVLDADEGWRQLSARLKRVRHVATVAAPPAYLEQHGLYTNPARARLIERLKDMNGKLELLDLASHLVRMREIKQAPELAAIERAIGITAEGILAVTDPAVLATYAYEYEVEADLTRAFRRRGAPHAFEPIVASGKRACTLHNVTNSGQLTAGELLVLDVGAEVSHYAADITRTVAIGEPSRRQEAVFAAVLEVQRYAKSLLKPGVLMRDYEGHVEQFMGEKLRELELLDGGEHDDVRRFYPHATSHHMGLSVHDAADYSQPLAAGMVLTVEPGIYIAQEGIGIRLEDDVLITEDGMRSLSDGLPKVLTFPKMEA